MPPKGKKRGCRIVSLDILSNLPENVIDNILMCLPLRDAVRTSILSKTWRYNWCRLPELTLDQALWETTNNLKPSTISFADIMYHLLALHVGPVTKFTLSIVNLRNSPKLDSLICFLSRNGIEHLVLQFSTDNPYKLPSSMFTCSQMRHLVLHNCLINPPPAFKGFNKLVSLKLHGVTVSSEVLRSLISRSNLLEQLVLHTLSISDHIQIKAPKLKSFEFTGRIKSISLKKSPLLAKLQLLDTEVTELSASGKHDFAKYFESFPALEHLQLNFCTVLFLAAGSGDIPAKLSSPLNCLKCLCLSDICLEELVEIKCVLCLLRSSPYLQDIQMKVHVFSDPGPDVIVNEIPADFSDVMLNHLRAVELEGITGTRPQMELIKLLLAKSPMLVRLLIQPKLGNESPETRLKVLAEMIKFPRASPKAEVDYKVDNSPV